MGNDKKKNRHDATSRKTHILSALSSRQKLLSYLPDVLVYIFAGKGENRRKVSSCV